MYLMPADLLGLGKSISSFGTTLALLLTFVVVMGGVVNFLVVYILGAVKLERDQNQKRMREYDAQHKS